MDKISELLQYVHRTNPEMTREKLQKPQRTVRNPDGLKQTGRR